MASSLSFADMSSAVSGTIGAVSQELIVLGIFLLSYATWYHLGLLKRRSRAAQKLIVVDGSGSGTPKKYSPRQGEQSIQKVVRSSKQDANTQAAEAQMLQHLEQHEFTRALNFYRTLCRDESRGSEHHFSEHFYVTFIESAARVGKTDVVERLLRAVRNSSLSPSHDFWRRVLKMLSSRKLFSTCLFVDVLFQGQLPVEKVVWSCLVNAALEVGKPERAASMLKQYQKADIIVKDHVLFFRTYLALKDVDAAEAMFNKLGAHTSSLMLNHLLLTCVNTGQPQRGLRLLHQAHGLEDEAGAAAGTLVDTISYNTVIKGLVQSGALSECFKCLREMIARSLKPDDVTFATILDVCIEESNFAAIGEIVNLSMEGEYQVGTVMYTLFIKGLVKANCLPKALELCEEMKRKAGTRPDVITYSVLIKALVDQHELDKALELVEDMKTAGHAPDDIILTHLLEGCRYAGNYQLGKKLFTDMLAQGVKPSEFSLVTMLKLLGRVGAHQEAHDLVAGWEAAHGHKPSVIHYTCLMSGCLRRKHYSLAWAAFELMKTSGVKPDGTAFSTLLPGMVAAQSWDRVVTLAKEALASPSKHSIPPETLSSALAHMHATDGHSKQAAELGELLQKAGMSLAPRRLQSARRPPASQPQAAWAAPRRAW